MNHEPWEPWQPLSMSPLIGISLSILREKNLLGDSSGRSTHLEIPTRTHDFRVGFTPSELQLRLRARSEDLDGPCLARPRIAVLPDTTYTTSNGGVSLNKNVFRRAFVDLNNSKQHEMEKKHEKQYITMRIQATTLEILKHQPSLVSPKPFAQSHHICIFGRGKQKNNTKNVQQSNSCFWGLCSASNWRSKFKIRARAVTYSRSDCLSFATSTNKSVISEHMFPAEVKDLAWCHTDPLWCPAAVSPHEQWKEPPIFLQANCNLATLTAQKVPRLSVFGRKYRTKRGLGDVYCGSAFTAVFSGATN